ncbi:unnamed protein product, partial [Schistosoma turkestanicum]
MFYYFDLKRDFSLRIVMNTRPNITSYDILFRLLNVKVNDADTKDNITQICHDFEQFVCRKQIPSDFNDLIHNLPDDVILEMLGNVNYPGMKFINDYFYESCKKARSESNQLKKAKLSAFLKHTYHGWLMSVDENEMNVMEEHFLDKNFDLNTLILALFLRNETTPLFSMKLVPADSPRSKPFIYITPGSLDAFTTLNATNETEGAVREHVFRYLQNVGALQKNKKMMDGVFELYSNIK